MIKLAIAAESAVVRAGLEALVASHPGIELAGAYPDLSAIEALEETALVLQAGALHRPQPCQWCGSELKACHQRPDPTTAAS